MWLKHCRGLHEQRVALAGTLAKLRGAALIDHLDGAEGRQITIDERGLKPTAPSTSGGFDGGTPVNVNCAAAGAATTVTAITATARGSAESGRMLRRLRTGPARVAPRATKGATHTPPRCTVRPGPSGACACGTGLHAGELCARTSGNRPIIGPAHVWTLRESPARHAPEAHDRADSLCAGGGPAASGAPRPCLPPQVDHPLLHLRRRIVGRERVGLDGARRVRAQRRRPGLPHEGPENPPHTASCPPRSRASLRSLIVHGPHS